MVLWYHLAAPQQGLQGRAPKGEADYPAAPMTPEPNDVEQSVRRVRRGCLFIAALIAALGVLFVSATGNLFYVTLVVAAVFLAVFSRFVR
jgi:fatty acid desaturase